MVDASTVQKMAVIPVIALLEGSTTDLKLCRDVLSLLRQVTRRSTTDHRLCRVLRQVTPTIEVDLQMIRFQTLKQTMFPCTKILNISNFPEFNFKQFCMRS